MVNNENAAGKASSFDLTALLFILLILGLVGAAIFEVANPAAEAYLSSLLIEDTLLPRPFSLQWLFTVPGFMIKFMLFPLTVSLALLLMLTKSRSILRSYKLEGLSGREPELAQRFEALAYEMGINTRLIFYWSPKETQEAFVFRGFGPYRICFTRGLIDCFGGRTSQLEAVAAHELAHIANNDVTRTEIAESLVKAYFTIWLLIASLQVLGSVGLFIVFQQRSVALDISFAFSLISVGVIYVIMNILSRYRQKYADALVVKLGKQEDLQGALSWLATFHAAGGATIFKSAKRLAFGITRVLPRELPGPAAIKQWLLAPDPTIWERLEAVIDPAVLYRPVWSLSLASGFIVFGLSGALALSPLAGSALAWVLASALVGAGLASAARQKSIWQRMKLLLLHLLLCSSGFFGGHLLFSLTEHLASSMPVPTEIAENVLKIEGLVPPSLASLSTAAVEAWYNTVYFSPGLLAGLLIVIAEWRPAAWLSRRLALSFSHPLLGRGLYSLGGLFFAAVFVLSSSSTFLGASYFAEGYRQQVLGLVPDPVPPGQNAVSSNYMPRERIEGTLDRAAWLYEQSISANPDFIWPYIQLAQIYLLKGAYNEVTGLLSLAPLQDKQSSVAYTIRGIANNAAGRPEEAVSDFTDAIRLDADNFAAYTMRADLYFKRGDYELAASDLGRVIDIDPGNQAAYVMRAASYAVRERFETALADYSRAAELLEETVGVAAGPRGDDPDFNYHVNLHLLALNEAVSYRSELLWHSLGVSVLQMDIFSQLISGESPEKTFGLAFPLQFLHLMAGNCHYELEQYELAEKSYRKATVSPEGLPGDDYSAGRAFLYLGEYDQAVEMFNRRINFAPELREPYFYRGMAFAYSGNIEAAFADFATYLGLPPGSPEKYILARIEQELPEEVILLLEGQNGGL